MRVPAPGHGPPLPQIPGEAGLGYSSGTPQILEGMAGLPFGVWLTVPGDVANVGVRGDCTGTGTEG
jgi:hypothetical protein